VIEEDTTDILFLRSVWQETGRSYLCRTKYRWLTVHVGSPDTRTGGDWRLKLTLSVVCALESRSSFACDKKTR
jgi:hypothetical protein